MTKRSNSLFARPENMVEKRYLKCSLPVFSSRLALRLGVVNTRDYMVKV